MSRYNVPPIANSFKMKVLHIKTTVTVLVLSSAELNFLTSSSYMYMYSDQNKLLSSCPRQPKKGNGQLFIANNIHFICTCIQMYVPTIQMEIFMYNVFNIFKFVNK